MKQNELSIRMWVYFCYNFPPIEMVVDYMVDYANERGVGYFDRQHLINKFNHCYDEYGSSGVMQRFFVELGKILQEALAHYAVHIWSPVGMGLTDEEKELLGINK